MTLPPLFPRLAVEQSIAPMEARLVDHLPDGDGWQFEPKWDGFRCLVFRDGEQVALMSKSGKPLGRYFPELVAAALAVPQDRFVADGEIILPLGGVLSFAALQSRLHPAPSRIARLSNEIPAELMLFDCLQLGARLLAGEPLDARREALDRLAPDLPPSVRTSPFTYEAPRAQLWLEGTGGALDGVIAKLRSDAYRPGERAMYKRKVRRTADCVVGGLRYDSAGTGVASLLLGLYDSAGLLHQVGFTSSFTAAQRRELAEKFASLKGCSPFSGSAPGGKSRWSKPGQSSEWTPLDPITVVEVAYDQVTGDRFRHGTAFVRWRPDKAPAQCTFEQLAAELRPEQLEQILAAPDR